MEADNEIDNIERVEHELEEGLGMLHKAIHMYEPFDFFYPSLSHLELVAFLHRSKDIFEELRKILEKQEWQKMEELRKKMMFILHEMERYQKSLRNNQKEYELLLTIQQNYQNLIFSMNVIHQNQEKYQNTLPPLAPAPAPVYQAPYSSLPRLELKYQPFSDRKDNEEQ